MFGGLMKVFWKNLVTSQKNTSGSIAWRMVMVMVMGTKFGHLNLSIMNKKRQFSHLHHSNFI